MTQRGSPNLPASLAAWSLVGLVLGFFLGTMGRATGSGFIIGMEGWVGPLGRIWVNALQMTVIPLVLTQLLSAVVRPDSAASTGRLGARTFGVCLAMLVAFGLSTLALTPYVLDLFRFPGQFAQTISGLDASQAGALVEGAGASGWLERFVPRNPFDAAVRGDLVQLLVFTLLVGLALGRLPEEGRAPVARFVRALADAMMILVVWVLWGTPIGVFALMLGFALQVGVGVVGVAGLYIGLLCGALVVALLVLYPLTRIVGGTPLTDFASAVLPAQVVAAGTQSSAATLPALLEGGRERLGLGDEVTGFVLPLCVSSFKLNLVVSQTFALLFFARVFGISVGFGEATAFLFGVIVISPGSPGLPRGAGGFKTLPLFLAAGIPIEAVVLLETVKTIPDIFFTILNSTSYMSVAAMLSRFQRGSS